MDEISQCLLGIHFLEYPKHCVREIGVSRPYTGLTSLPIWFVVQVTKIWNMTWVPMCVPSSCAGKNQISSRFLVSRTWSLPLPLIVVQTWEIIMCILTVLTMPVLKCYSNAVVANHAVPRVQWHFAAAESVKLSMRHLHCAVKQGIVGLHCSSYRWTNPLKGACSACLWCTNGHWPLQHCIFH